MTRLTPAQLDRVRHTVASVIEEWQLSHRIERRKEDYELECLLVAAVEAMHGAGIFNQEGESPEREGD